MKSSQACAKLKRRMQNAEFRVHRSSFIVQLMRVRKLVWAAVFLLAAGLRLAMAAAGDLPKETIAKDGVPMVLVPAGTFWMGLPEGVGLDDEQPHALGKPHPECPGRHQ